MHCPALTGIFLGMAFSDGPFLGLARTWTPKGHGYPSGDEAWH
jgi:hypothetical protein